MTADNRYGTILEKVHWGPSRDRRLAMLDAQIDRDAEEQHTAIQALGKGDQS